MVYPTLAKLAFVFGILNIIGLILYVFSCRCVLGRWVDLSKNKKYMNFYKYHCYYLWFFIISVLVHSVLALIVYGNPF